MDLVKKLEEFRDRERSLKWDGTFEQYFEIAVKQPTVAQLSHERIYNMIMAAGTQTTPLGYTHYNFFDGEIFGLDRPLLQLMEYFHSSAQRLEVRKRILLLMGPVGGGKSTIVSLLKRGLENYARATAGAVYAIKSCPMHEEPLHLIPNDLRADVQREYGLYIEGDLCPKCRYMVDHEYQGKIEQVPVERLLLSEKHRVGIGTFTPSDPKCVTGDTLVLTDHGLRTMEEIYLSLDQKPQADAFVPFTTTIVGLEGAESTAKFYCGGFQPIFEVETDLGFRLRGTANHPLMTLHPGGEMVWKKIGDLQPDDYVALARGTEVWGTSSPLPPSFSPLPKQPRRMTPSLAYWLGLLTAHGSVTNDETRFTNASTTLIDQFVTLTHDLFGEAAIPCREAATSHTTVAINNTSLATWLHRELGIARGAEAKSIPAVVLASSRSDILAFLEGLFWGDATIRGNANQTNLFTYTTKSRTLARQVQTILLNLGIVGSLGTATINAACSYSVAIHDDAVVDLVDCIPSLRDKATSPISARREGKTNSGNLPQGDALLNTQGRDAELAQIKAGDRPLTYNRAPHALQASPHSGHTALATVVQHDYAWLKVREIRNAGIEPVYDLLVPGTHSFIADGFLQHNSQDVAELVGGMDLATIGEIGSESDPRAYRFDGELNVANRGMVEFVEILKCLAGDSLIFTPLGIRRIDSFAPPDHPVGESRPIALQVATSTGIETAAHIYRAGVSATKRITTRRGFVQEGTPDHRVQVVNTDGVLVWRRHDQLELGDWLVLQKGQNVWGQDVALNGTPHNDWPSRNIRMPHRMTPELARLLGYLVAKGDTRSDGTVRIAVTETSIRDDVVQLLHSIFGITPELHEGVVQVNSGPLLDFLQRIGYRTGADNKEIPWAVLQSSRASMLEFLAGYFAGDGTVNLRGRISWTTASATLAEQLQIVLLNLGVVTRRTQYHARAMNGIKASDYWNVAATGADADLLAAQMRLIPQRMRLNYERSSAEHSRNGQHAERADLIPHTQQYWVAISDAVQQTVIARAQASGGYHTDAPMGAQHILQEDATHLHMLRTGTNTCTRTMATKILGKLEGWVEPPPGLTALLNASQFYDPIVAIEDGEEECWDINVPGSNTFIANGIVNHNCDEKFLYVLLTLSQEQNIKTGRFSMIYADEVVVSHTNESEYRAFVGNRKSEALQDRIILVKVPYNLRVSDEVKIYDKLLSQSALQNIHIAPHTLRIASVFAVLTRLEESKKAGMSRMKKMKLYDGEDLEDFKTKDVRELQDEAEREGMDGISPRYVINRLSSALVKDNITCINAIDALRALRDGLDQHTGITREQREQYLDFINEARREYDEMVKKEVQRAFVYSYEESARTLLNNYLDNVEAFCNKTKLRDPITDEEMEPDERLMRSIEEQIGVSQNAAKAFREEILIRISSLARRGQPFDYNSHERLKEAIEKKLFADLRDVVKITTSSRTPDGEQLKRINEVSNRLISNHGYCSVCANELLRYAGSLLSR